MDVAIVIPVFNQVHYTVKCLDSLRNAGVPESRTVVVDNASTDETASFLAQRPQLHVIRNSVNRFCGAWTQGAKAAGQPEWTVVLNNDVLIPPGWLEGLTQFAEQEKVDVVSPAFCEGDQDYDFVAYASSFMKKMAGVQRPGIANGACFMVHRRVFDAIGYFDEDPRLGGYQDDEFFRRSRQNGFHLAMTGRSFLHHFGSITQKAVVARMNQPGASLGDRSYYRQKYQLTWFKRQRERWLQKFMNAKWKKSELRRYGCTLIAYRQNGEFVWL